MSADERIEQLRADVSANDAEIVAHVNERLRIVREIWALKASSGAGRLDPDRERRLLDQLRATNAGPLSNEGLERLVADLLALTKRELGPG